MTIKLNIIQQVDIEPITQEVLEQWIVEKIAEQNPDITVTSINFTQKRSPARMEVDVTATFGGQAYISTGDKPVASKEEEPMKEDTALHTALQKGAGMVDDTQQDTLFPEPSVLTPQTSDTSIIDEVLAESSGDIAKLFNLPK